MSSPVQDRESEVPPLPDEDAVAPRISEIERIRSLPERAPFVVEKDRRRGAYVQATEDLVREMTAKFARPRLSCACRDRQVESLGGGRLVVFHEAEGDGVPPLPLEVSLDVFLDDIVGDATENKPVRQVVESLRRGQTATLKGLGHPFCIKTFKPVQAWTLYEIPLAQGAVGRLAVGSGKTFVSILAPLTTPVRTAILLASPSQRAHYRQAYLQIREHFRVPSLVFEDRSFIVPGAPTLHFAPYSLLSNPKSTIYLESFDDLDMIVCDEAHSVAARTSARTMRLLRLLAKRGDVILCCWSGSLVNKSIKDAAHLFAHALGLQSPYPIPPDDVESWAAVLDPSPCPDTSSSTASSLRAAFGNPNRKTFGVGALLLGNDDIRNGFRARSDRTLGVISTRGASAPCSIEIKKREAPKIPPAVKQALDLVRNDWLRADGEEIAEAFEQSRCVRHAAVGLYYYWSYPRGEPDDLIERWFAARKRYMKQLRQKLLFGERYLDSPKLCADAAVRAFLEPRYSGSLPVWPCDAWPEWLEVKDLVQPVPRAKFIAGCPTCGTLLVGRTCKCGFVGVGDPVGEFIAKDAAKWATENRGIVWTWSNTLGRKIAEYAGLPYHGGGVDAEDRILGRIPAVDGVVEKGQRSIVASIRAHSEGRDQLQYRFCDQLVVEIPSSSKGWEQLLGRLARIGQTADTIRTGAYLHISETIDAFRSALRDAEFVEGTTGNSQLLLAADIGDDCF